MDKDERWKFDFWTVFFSVISLILFNLALFFPEQRIMILGFLAISIIFAVILFYFQRINSNEKSVKDLQQEFSKLSAIITERFNYIKEIYNLKMEVELLKKRDKKAQINVLDIIKILIAIILVYVIIQVLKSLQ